MDCTACTTENLRLVPYIAIGIVGHVSRSEQVQHLRETISADVLSIDDGDMGCDANHDHVAQSLSWINSTWSVIVEDDAQPVSDFRAQLEEALVMAPTPVVSLYLGKLRPPHWQRRIATAVREAGRKDARWIVGTGLLHAVGYAIKTNLLPSLLTHTSTRPVDEHITNWARTYGHLVSYTFPSLVDHMDGPTIVDHPDGKPRKPGRTAWTTGTREQWNTNAVTLR